MRRTRNDTRTARADHVMAQVEAARDEIVAFTAEMIRIRTVNPPGDCYPECAELIGRRLAEAGLAVEYVEATGRPEHTRTHPRVNVVGRGGGAGGAADRNRTGPRLHLNGHFDVVPPGEGWTVDPFAGQVRDGRIYGRGASDMKSGIAAAVLAVEAIRRAGIDLGGAIDISATVDEESGGFAVVAHGHAAHGSMSHLGRNAIDDMGALLEAFRARLGPELALRCSALPVVPAPSRLPSLNVNAITGGQAGADTQSPCVADRCVATFDRRFIPEEPFDEVRAEIADLVAAIERESPGRSFTIEERMVVHPTGTPPASPLVRALSGAVRDVCGQEAELVASPGTYDQKHFARIAGVEHCVAYGPGALEEAHQPDESCSVDDLVACTQVLALAVAGLTAATH